ncbi:MAG: hypothetical protein ACR2OU_12245 [Thermomicrobiales bacterium]
MILTVLLANEPLAYRDAITVAFRILRPEITVIAVEPAKLDVNILEHDPQVVICSAFTIILKREVPIWIVLYPDGSPGATLQILGKRSTVSHIDLDGIVHLIDQTNQFVHDQRN